MMGEGPRHASLSNAEYTLWSPVQEASHDSNSLSDGSQGIVRLRSCLVHSGEGKAFK